MAIVIDEKTKKNLFNEALLAATHSYSPYSSFPVGAAILYSSGVVVTGCNIENRSFGLTNCAERTAIFKAISTGVSGNPVALAIAAPKSDTPIPPCGACRQVLSEFMDSSTPIIFGVSADALISATLGELYPYDSLHELASGK